MRERSSQRTRELEGEVRQLEKRLKMALRENLRLRKELDRLSGFYDQNSSEDGEKFDPIPRKIEPSFKCEKCANTTSKIIDLGVIGKKKMLFEVCVQCKHRKKL